MDFCITTNLHLYWGDNHNVPDDLIIDAKREPGNSKISLNSEV